MKLYKWKKGDGKQLLGWLVAVLVGGVIALPLSILGVTSIDDIIIPAFFIIGFITFIGGIFKWIFRLQKWLYPKLYVHHFQRIIRNQCNFLRILFLWLEIQPKNDAFLHIGEIRHAETKASEQLDFTVDSFNRAI